MSILSDYTKQSCIMLYFVLSYHFTSYPRVETFGLLERPMRWCSRSALSRRRPSAWPRSAWLPCSSWPKGSGTPLSVVYDMCICICRAKRLGHPVIGSTSNCKWLSLLLFLLWFMIIISIIRIIIVMISVIIVVIYKKSRAKSFAGSGFM